MTLFKGQKLAHYRIVSPLGDGAMGAVYRARDTRLEREVAIKLLPREFSDDPERVARFQREGKALAALNHKNIGQIFGIESEGNLRFLVLELVPGETLEDRLRRGPLELEETLSIARQVVDGLEAAHHAGVIHRDLKPGNIRVTPDGRVKLLDFGLAKPTRAASEDWTEAPEALDELAANAEWTEPGRVLGTPSYMAPEQARGAVVDRRTDVWAFGCVLYECLSGAKAFCGSSMLDVIRAVLDGDVDLAKLPPKTPKKVRELVARCLVKDPLARLDDIGEAREALERREADTSSARRLVAVSSIGAGVVLALGIGWFVGRASVHASGSASFRRVGVQHGFMPSARFSRDAKSVAWGASADLAVKAFATESDGRAARELASPDAQLVGLSSSGEVFAIVDRRREGEQAGGGRLVAAGSGAAVRELASGVFDADVAADGAQFAVVLGKLGAERLEFPIGHVLAESHGWISSPRISPDQKRVAFVEHPAAGDARGIAKCLDLNGVLERSSDERERLLALCWSARGDELWFSSYSDERGGEVIALAGDSSTRLVLRTPNSIRIQDVAADGRLLAIDHSIHASPSGVSGSVNSANLDVSPDAQLFAGRANAVESELFVVELH